MAGNFWVVFQVVVSFPPCKKKLELNFCFLFVERTEGGCAVEVVCGEEAERWSRAENIRNWRKVRNGAFSWLPNSCNFYCHCLVPGHQARRVGKGHVTTSPQIRIWHLHAQEARRIEGLLIYRLADELNEITKMHFSCI